MTLTQIREKIEFELSLTKKKSIKDLKKFMKELKWNLKQSKALMVKHRNSRSISYRDS